MSELLTFVGAGILGGLILNVMPCVLPVLFFKVHGWVSQGNTTSSQRRKESIAFLAGVLVCFTVLAVVVEGLRQTGESMLWGEQMAAPGFVASIVVLLVVFGLNALGVFEFSFSVSGGHGDGGNALWASFSHGALITLVSTPCSAPILGAATTAALAQSAQWYETLILFWSIGLGLSLPVLIVGFVPSAHRLLPKPGAWMNTFKILVGFTLIGAAVFFIGTLQGQISRAAVTDFLFFLVLLALGLVLYEGSRTHQEGLKRRLTLAALLCGLALGAYSLINLDPVGESNTAGAAVQGSAGGHVKWVSFAPESRQIESTLAGAKRTNQAVFVDFTADWCVNCKAFEKTHIDTEAMAEVFQSTKVIPAKADYTKKDPPLRKMLEALGRSGLPTYAIYFPDGSVDLLPNGPPLGLEDKLRSAAAKLEKRPNIAD